MSTERPIDRPTGEDQLRALTEAAALLARATDLDATLEGILHVSCRAVGASSGVVFLRHPDRPELQLASAVGVDEETLAALEAAVGDQDHPVTAAARDLSAVFGREEIGPDGAPVVAADVPLVVVRQGLDLPLGVVSFSWPAPYALDEVDEQVVRAAADLLAVAVDRAHLATLISERSEWFERIAHTDPLTGLANRRTFDRMLELELARAGRQGGEVSVAVFDVDAFGAINAAAGHETGDDILRQVAAVLAESVRLVDTIARYGGDEFALIAPGSAGSTVARRVLDRIARLEPVNGQVISVSAGIARFPVDGTSPDELLAAAQAALETARAAGPGQIATTGSAAV